MYGARHLLTMGESRCFLQQIIVIIVLSDIAFDQDLDSWEVLNETLLRFVSA